MCCSTPLKGLLTGAPLCWESCHNQEAETCVLHRKAGELLQLLRGTYDGSRQTYAELVITDR
jgi:hypothetical protein